MQKAPCSNEHGAFFVFWLPGGRAVLMAEFSEWENTAKNSRHVEKLYGVQKYYKKKADNDNKECDTV